jgi:hypothetical protein
VKHTVKVFVYEFRVPGHEYVLGLRKVLVCLCLQHTPFSEREGIAQVKTLAILERTAATMEMTRPASLRYKE